MTFTIKVENLTKMYGDLVAVDHINFTVAQGEIFGFLGPNGAGKTTTIKMLSCLMRPDDGTAAIAGYDTVRDSRQVRKIIGVVPEESNLYNELTAWDNLLFMTQLYGVPRGNRAQKVRELLELFGLYEHRNKRFATLSKGLKRRLTIAAGLVHEPQILFLDEPTVGLDVVSARFIRRLITNMKLQEITIFLTSHYIGEVDLLCDRVAILTKGRIVTIDSPDALKVSRQADTVLEVMLNQGIDQLKEEMERSNLGHITKNHNRLKISTGNPSLVFTFISDFVKEHKLEIRAINTLTPSLEDAFVRITGITPEKMKAEKAQYR